MPTVDIVAAAHQLSWRCCRSPRLSIVRAMRDLPPGRLVGTRGPGLFFLMPGAERMRKIDLRIVTHQVRAQEAITRQRFTRNVNVTVKVNAPENNSTIVFPCRSSYCRAS